MTAIHDICSLDYLLGTLSTAYKGIITSLVVKDFCMTEQAGTVTFKGTILSLPPGNYEAALIQKGVELARTVLEGGQFQLKDRASRIRAADDLQIDIVQAGRHIGTFLLQKQTQDGFFQSAVELSRELKGIDFKLLTVPLRNQVGLLRQAEDIVTKILSTKKDWERFSEQLNSFIQDFFWSARSSFYDAYELLVHFSRKSAEAVRHHGSSKPVANLLADLELVLDHETDERAMRHAVDVWLSELDRSQLDLSLHLRRAVALFQQISRMLPGAPLASSLARLADAVRARISSLPVVTSGILERLGRVSPNLSDALEPFSARARTDLSGRLDNAVTDLKHGDMNSLFPVLSEIAPDLVDASRMFKTLFGAVAKNINADSADAAENLLEELLSHAPDVSFQAVSGIKTDLPPIIETLITLERIDLCFRLFNAVMQLASPVRDEIVMDPQIVSAVLRSGSRDLIDRYIGLLTGIAIPAARVRAISAETWAEVVNPLHLDRLAWFMDILQLGDARFRPVLAHVIANLAITGVFIPDDRLFQRRTSAYLNSPAMEGDFVLNFLLLEKLPVYYHEVGAVSRIRDYSTEIDAWGNDPILYFVRKQVHVNASNYNVTLLETVIRSWAAKEPDLLRSVLPQDVFAGIKPELFDRYSRFIRPFLASLGVLSGQNLDFEKLRQVPEEELAPKTRDGQLDEVPTKILLFCRLYQEVVKKYSRTGTRTESGEGPSAIAEYLKRMRTLARVVQAKEQTKAVESLYFKRHIAFGIPSVLGTYHEPKFDAFGEFLKAGAKIRPLLEQTTVSIEAGGSDTGSILVWLDALIDCWELLKLQGFRNMQIDELISVKRNNGLRFSQIADLLAIWQKELAWIVESIGRTFHAPIVTIIKMLPLEDLPDHLLSLGAEKPDFESRAADVVIRDIIAVVPGLMEADRIADRLHHKIRQIAEMSDGTIPPEFPHEERKWFDLFDLSDADAMSFAPELGGKAKNLVFLHNRKFQVPAGVVVPPQAAVDDGSREFSAPLKQAVARIEERTGRGFGSRAKPLFLSVRSGSYISMPGILSTILYCGINRETMEAVLRETGDARYALDSYRRFMEQYSTNVFDLDIGLFERLRDDVVQQAGCSGPDQLTEAELRRLIERYETVLQEKNMSIPQDVDEQLRQAVHAVAGSWRSRRAQQFRRATKTSDFWGTPVLLMQMIPGNVRGAGTSVFFTRNPFTYEPTVFGETRSEATGDELVYGRRLNRPLSRNQAAIRRGEGPNGGRRSLEEVDPELYALHELIARDIEAAMGGLPQEVEVTYTGTPDGERALFLLQTRRMEFSAGAVGRFDEICAMEARVIGRGIGAHGGAVSGVASFADHPEQAERLARESNMPVILFRTTANTDDVSLMPAVSGIVTAAGGVTSHAAVLAQKFGINAVVACSDLVIEKNDQGEPFARFDGHVVHEGSVVSIDGSTGLVFSGSCFSISTVLR